MDSSLVLAILRDDESSLMIDVFGHPAGRQLMSAPPQLSEGEGVGECDLVLLTKQSLSFTAKDSPKLLFTLLAWMCSGQ